MDTIKQLKVVMVGDGLVGKTPLCSVLAGQDFLPEHDPTVCK